MSKDTTQIKTRNNYDTKIVDQLCKNNNNCSRSYIYRNLKPANNSETAVKIRDEYKRLEHLRDYAFNLKPAN